MFRTAATKIAHNSTIPALAGNNELRLLQDVITSKKLVINSLERLSNDLTKSTEALKHWGLCEGEDLGNTLSACTTLIAHFSASLGSFSSHICYIRECLKAIRTREEELDEQNRRRRNLFSRADAAEKKLNKMGPEHKNIRQQTDSLMALREQIRGMDVEIMNEEAALSDWKRTKTKEFMGVLFGGLLECSEKGTIIATSGRSIISHVPVERTEPGLPRAPYFGQAHVESLVVEAERGLHRIQFNAEIGPAGSVGYTGERSHSQQSASPPESYKLLDAPATYLPPPSGPSQLMHEFGAYSPDPHRSQTFSPNSKTGPPYENIRSWNEGGTGSRSQFATVPNNQASRPQNSGFGSVHRASDADSSSPMFNSAPGAGQYMNGGSPNFDASAPPESPTNTTAFKISFSTNGSPSIGNSRPATYGDRPLPHRLSSSLVASLGPSWTVDGGAPRLDASSPLGSPRPLAAVPKPSHSRTPSASGDSGSSVVGSQGHPLSHPLSPSLTTALGSERSTGGGAPRLDGSSSSTIAIGPSLVRKSPPAVDSVSSVRSSRSRERKLSHRLSTSVTTAVETGRNMDGETPHLDGNSTPQGLQQPSNNDRSPSPSANGYSGSTVTTEPHGYPDPPPSYVPLGPPPGAAPAAVPGNRSFEPPTPSETSETRNGEEDDLTLAYMAKDDSHDRPDRTVKFSDSPPSAVEDLRPEMNESSLNAQAAKEISQQMSVNSTPLIPPSLPFAGRRSVSPRPSVATDLPNVSYRRDRDAVSPPVSRASPSFVSESSNASGNDTPYRTPPEYLSGYPTSRIGSPPTSLASPVTPGTKTISAAAFRRPNMRPAGSSNANLSEDGLADISPLNVQKRSLPGVPSVNRPQGSTGAGMPRVPSAPVVQGAPSDRGRNPRALSGSRLAGDDGVLDDDFDYIGAYLDTGAPQPTSGYGAGRFATNLENQGFDSR